MPLLDNLFSSSNMSKTNQPQNSDKSLSLYAFIFSVTIYISIFFIFDLSPSSLFRNTKFWFVISNTLILIIAADYGSFSSSPRNNLDLYEAYVSKSRTAPPSYSTTSPVYMKSKKVVLDPQENFHDSRENFHDKEMITIPKENPGLEIVIKPDPVKTVKVLTCEFESDVLAHRKARSRTCRRRSSGKVRTPESRMVLRRCESERREHVRVVDEEEKEKEEENEFSSMSNEELNKRVEEFIQRFNRQIRLQKLEAASAGNF